MVLFPSTLGRGKTSYNFFCRGGPQYLSNFYDFWQQEL